MLDALPDEGEAALEGGFSLPNRRVDGVVDGVEELSDLMNAEKCIGVEDERNNEFARSECAAVKGRVPRVGEGVAAVGTSNSGTVVPGLDGGFATLWTGCLFPGLLTAPLDLRIERLWPQHY